MKTAIGLKLLTTSILVLGATDTLAGGIKLGSNSVGISTPGPTQSATINGVNYNNGVTTLVQSAAFGEQDFTSLNAKGASGNLTNEVLQIVQPNRNAVFLGKVTNNEVTNFAGTLLANGNVVIENQAGIIFAPGSRVNVGGLAATTASSVIKNPDGSYHFDGLTTNSGVEFGGAVQTSNNGYVIALAKNIIVDKGKSDYVGTDGTVYASGLKGSLTLAAGSQSYDVTLVGQPKITYSAGNLSNSNVIVLGNASAEGDVVIQAKASDIYSSVLNLQGFETGTNITINGSSDVNIGDSNASALTNFIAANNVTITAGKDLNNNGGSIYGYKKTTINAGGKVNFTGSYSSFYKAYSEEDSHILDITSGGDTNINNYNFKVDNFDVTSGGNFNFNGNFAGLSSVRTQNFFGIIAPGGFTRTSFTVNAAGDANFNNNFDAGKIETGTLAVNANNVSLNDKISIINNEGIETLAYNPVYRTELPVSEYGYVNVHAKGSLYSNANISTSTLLDKNNYAVYEGIGGPVVYNSLQNAPAYYSSISLKADGAFTNTANAEYNTAQSGADIYRVSGVPQTIISIPHVSGDVILSGGNGSNLDDKTVTSHTSAKGVTTTTSKLAIASQIHAQGTSRALSGSVSVKETDIGAKKAKTVLVY